MTEVNLQLKSSKDAPGISRSRLAAIRDDLEPRFDDVALILSELVSNSVRHSGNGSVTVMVRTDGENVRLEVTDGGPCFELSQVSGDGLGLAIVERVADSWGIDCEGMCTVWVEMGLAGPEAATAR